MADRLVVKHAGKLLDVLAQHLADPSRNTWSKNSLRQRLRLGCVEVNGTVADRADAVLLAGDVVEILSKAAGRRPLPKKDGKLAELSVLFDNEHLIAIDKPCGLLSVSTGEERERTALVMTRELLSLKGQRNLWPVHRLDRETSGVLLFAKLRQTCDDVQADWQNAHKSYAAIVEGLVAPAAGTVDQPLWEDKNLRVRVGAHEGAKEARTHYTTVTATSVPQRAAGRERTHLNVRLDTGRKHQIRAHLAWLGNAIVGDDRYGSADARLCLHAQELRLRAPVSGISVCIQAPIPRMLLRALR